LSAIARHLEISAPGMYRYYASRDELVTALIVDSYNDLADALERTSAEWAREPLEKRLYEVILVYRVWAISHPIDFQLIYGNPIPGYHAPEDATTEPARRGFGVILNILLEAFIQNKLIWLQENFSLPDGLQVGLFPLSETEESSLPEVVIYAGLVGWYHIHGMILLELFNHSQTLVSNTGLFYQHEVASMLKSMGLNVGE